MTAIYEPLTVSERTELWRRMWSALGHINEELYALGQCPGIIRDMVYGSGLETSVRGLYDDQLQLIRDFDAYLTTGQVST